MLSRSVAATVGLAVLGAGCSGTHAVTPAQELSQRAAQGRDRSYTADYALTGGGPGGPATAHVAIRPGSYNVEVSSGGTTSALIGTSAGTVSCQLAQPPQCFTAAGPGQPVPDLLDAGIQRLFTSYLDQLARHVKAYEVRRAARLSGSGSACFDVAPRPPAAPPVVAKGRYCLAPDGTPTAVTFPSGTLSVTKVGPPPADTAFTPPAMPLPLPSPSGSTPPSLPPSASSSPPAPAPPAPAPPAPAPPAPAPPSPS